MTRANTRMAWCVAFLLCATAAEAAPSITLSKRIGPPTTKILISGRGFQPNVGVDIYFDTKDEALVVTNNEGEFHKAVIHAPRSAHPGKHWVTALERNNDQGDQELFVVNTNWDQFHFDANGTRLNPYENVLNDKTVGNLNLKWRYTTNLWVVSSPVVADGVLYVGSGDFNVYALDARNGVKLWNYPTGDFVVASPAVANRVVYVGSEDSNFYALKTSNGEKLWSYATGQVSSPAVVANGVVYVGAGGGAFALDAATGSLIWNYPTGVSPDYLSNVVAGVIYVGSYNGDIYALDASSGALLWSTYVPVAILAPPTVANGILFVGGQNINQNMYALDASTGATLWSSHRCQETMQVTPAVANGVVYVGCDDGYVYALNPLTGAPLWSYFTAKNTTPTPVVRVC